MTSSLRGQFETFVDSATAFDQFVEDMTVGLRESGVTFTPAPDGQLAAGTEIFAKVHTWLPGERLLISATDSDNTTEIEIRFERATAGTEVTFEIRNWAASLGPWGDVGGWFGLHVAAPILAALVPSTVGDWLTDRVARRPSGQQSRATYRDPLYHYPNFRVILEELALTPNDALLDVGCGGGAFLRECLKSGCHVAGIDHSMEMVQVARASNDAAVAEGRAVIVHGEADQLPFADSHFTRAAMTGVLGFLQAPVACVAEIRRVLKPGGRFVMLGSDVRLRGTPAAPEPIASRLRFYDDQELKEIGLAAGFDHVDVIQRDLSTHALAVGVPEEHIALFTGMTSFLVARK